MIASYPSTSLRSRQRAVKEAARQEPVLITDNDDPFVMAACCAYRSPLEEALAEQLYASEITAAVARGRACIARGDYVVGLDALVAESNRRRLARG